MSHPRPISVIVLNWDRYAEVGRVLRALALQEYRNFEVVVVSNQIDRLQEFDEMARAIPVDQTVANVSAARNAGLAVARGEIIAFCDDDAVPEPSWLAKLLPAFDNPEVGAAGGLVVGRNGVSVQWGLTEVNCEGFDQTLPQVDKAQIFAPGRTAAIKTPGTNCAFRRAALAEIGGFDEAFSYYLDEADLNLRMNATRWQTAYVPAARVVHGYASNAWRKRNRAPTDLREVGASQMVFLRKHCPASARTVAASAFCEHQRRRLIEMMTIGYLEPRDVMPLLASLSKGLAEGEHRNITPPPPVDPHSAAIRPFVGPQQPEKKMYRARLFTRGSVLRSARTAARSGQSVTVIEVLPSARALTRKFGDAGFWHHRVGQFGRMDRVAGHFHLRSNADTFQREVEAIDDFR